MMLKISRYIVSFAVIAAASVFTVSCRQRHSANANHFGQEYSASILEQVVIPSDVKSQLLEYPGFTVSFNPDYHVPNYVSWELTRDECSKNVVGKRQNKFAPDTSVIGCPSLDDYRGSGYDRGHMAPAGDMKWDEEVNDACFLLTNMCPQDNALNSGAWNTLENKCRDWAIRDSAIVIICGPVLTDKITKSIGANQVAVPERFFKVILSPYSYPPQGIGFIMPNTKVLGGLQATACSIDRVEEITGFDFFSALPDDIEDVVEAQEAFARWTRK